MSGFSYRKNLDGSHHPPINMRFTGGNAVPIQIGDLVNLDTNGDIALVAAGDPIAGVVVGVETKDGAPVSPDSGTLDTYTMASDNETDEEKQVVIIPALPNYLFYNDASATLSENVLLDYFDTSDENNVDVAATSVCTGATTRQVQLIEIDPDNDGDVSKGLFRIVETQIQGTAIVAV